MFRCHLCRQATPLQGAGRQVLLLFLSALPPRKVARRLGVKKGGSKYLGGKIAFLEIPWGYNEDAMGYACPPVSYMARSEILEQTMEVHRHRWENHPAIMEVNAEFSSKPWS